jgi:hypothetical protein
MAEIWYLVTSIIQVYHIVGSVFGPVRFLLPVCRLSWSLYTLNIYAHFSSHFSQQLLQEVRICRIHKRFPRYGVPIWRLWPNIRSLSSIVAEKNVTKNVPFFVAFFSATIDGRNLIFGHKLHIVGSVFWPVRFLLPVCQRAGPKTLPTIWHTYMKLVTKYQIPVINSCWEKCDEKCTYTNVC